MSVEGVKWARSQRGLKPAAKILLICLGDYHTKMHGCFVGQETMADECEMSIRSIRDDLEALEARGLFRRVHGPRKKVGFRKGGEFRSDRCILSFENDFSDPTAQGENRPAPAAKLAGGAVDTSGKKCRSPAADFAA